MLAVGSARAGAHEDRSNTGVLRRLHIRRRVADEPALAQVDVQIARGLFDHSDGGLAAIAADFQLRPFAWESCIRMVRTKIDAIDERVFHAQESFEFVMDEL